MTKTGRALIVIGAGIGPDPSAVAAYDRVLLVEPHPDHVEELKDLVAEHPTWDLVEAAFYQRGAATLHLTTPAQFSSTAEPLPRLFDRYPGVAPAGSLSPRTVTLRTLSKQLLEGGAVEIWLEVAEVLPSLLSTWADCPRLEAVRVTLPTEPLYAGAIGLAELEVYAQHKHLALQVTNADAHFAQCTLTRDHDAERQGLQQQLEDAKAHLEAAQTKAAGAKDTEQAQANEVAQLTAQNAELAATLEELRIAHAQLQADKSKLQDELAAQLERLTSLSDTDFERVDVLRMQQENIQAHSKLAALHGELDRLRIVASETDSVVSAVKERSDAQHRSASASLRRLTEERDALRQDVAKLSKKLAKAAKKRKNKG